MSDKLHSGANPSEGADHLLGLLQSPAPAGRRTRLPDVVAEELTDEIFSRGLTPGDALPTEPEMLQQFDVSRATLREALRILETRGVLSMRTGHGRGPVVATPSLQALIDSLKLNLRFLEISFGEVLATREAIEPGLAAQAAAHRTEEDLRALRTIHAAMLETAWDSPRMRVLNREFHTQIAAASRNRPLAMLWSAISTVADGQDVTGVLTEMVWDAGNAAHAAILAAVQSGDSERAERRMRAHVEAFHKAMRTIARERVADPAFPAR
jgi:GntR family transcriptional repressor for pyruvate dehydrogenase complex